jgi:hypothetical protein
MSAGRELSEPKEHAYTYMLNPPSFALSPCTFWFTLLCGLTHKQKEKEYPLLASPSVLLALATYTWGLLFSSDKYISFVNDF